MVYRDMNADRFVFDGTREQHMSSVGAAGRSALAPTTIRASIDTGNGLTDWAASHPVVTATTFAATTGAGAVAGFKLLHRGYPGAIVGGMLGVGAAAGALLVKNLLSHPSAP